MATGNKRLMKDIQQMRSEELASIGIYYDYDDADVSKGTGLVFGPPETPYEDVPLVFSVSIPSDYPFNSPQVLVRTSDGITRFHPNLYVQGKVCLSILGTWSGPKWVSTMNIATVFKSILSILNDNPIVNEPSWENYTLADSHAKNYAEWVEYNLLKHVVLEARNFRAGPQRATLWEPFREVLNNVWSKWWARILKKIDIKASVTPSVQYSSIVYGMGGTADWARLAKDAAAVK